MGSKEIKLSYIELAAKDKDTFLESPSLWYSEKSKGNLKKTCSVS